MARKTVTVDGLPFDLEDQAAGVVEKLLADRKSANDAKETAEAKAKQIAEDSAKLVADTKEAHGRAVADHAKATKDLEAKIVSQDQIDALVEERAKVVGDATKLFPGLEVKGKSNHQIRLAAVIDAAAKSTDAKAVTDAIFGTLALDKADELTMQAAFKALTATVTTVDTARANGDEEVSKALLANDGDKKETQTLSARDAWIERMQNGTATKPAK